MCALCSPDFNSAGCFEMSRMFQISFGWVCRQKQKTPFKISSTVQLYPVPYKFDSSVNLGTGFLFTKQTLKEAASAMKLKVFLFCHTYDDAHPRIFALIAFFRRKYVGQCVSRSVSIPDCCLKAGSTNVVPQINRQAVL